MGFRVFSGYVISSHLHGLSPFLPPAQSPLGSGFKGLDAQLRTQQARIAARRTVNKWITERKKQPNQKPMHANKPRH